MDILHSAALTTALCMVMLFQGIEANMTVSFQFYSFTNEPGFRSSGKCCDLFCDACDTLFYFCFDLPEGDNTFAVCPYGAYETGEYDDKNSIIFNAHDLYGGVTNPINIDVDSGAVKMKIKVQDHDHTSGWDDIDAYFETWSGPAAASDGELEREPFTYSGVRANTPTSLVVHIGGQCHPHFYGDLCQLYCPDGYDVAMGTCIQPRLEQPQVEEPQVEESGHVVSSKESDMNVLIIALIVGILVAILVVIIAVAVVYRYKRKMNSQDRGTAMGVTSGTDTEAQFDNPVYGDQRNASVMTSPWAAAVPVSNNDQRYCSGTNAGVAPSPPPYDYDNIAGIMAKQDRLERDKLAAFSQGTAGNASNLYDTPRTNASGDHGVEQAPPLPKKIRV